ncbi:MAG TPA: response regulator [Thermoanaerobaculia bacterium]|nr:response regulator [Thermoanaerobaculia bacterium]
MKPLALVIENDAGTRRLLDVLLSRVGMDVDLAPSGTDALILLQNVQYDVVLIDLFLPGKSGLELLEWIAEERPELLARAVVVSSAPPSRLDELSARWPQIRTIRKPFELGEVLETTQAIVADRVPRVQTPAEKFCRHSIRAGAKAGVVVARRDEYISPVLSFGYTREMIDQYFPLPLDAPYPLTATMRNGKPVWIASLVMAAPDYPTLAPVWEANESRALATVPLLESSRVVGAVGWSFREPRLFSPAEQQVFTEIAEALPDWLNLDKQSTTPVSA